MPEFLDIDADRLCKLKQFAFRLMDDEDGKMLFDEYEPYIEAITVGEALQVFESLLSQHAPVEKAKNTIGKLFNLFYKPINAIKWDKPKEEHFLHYLMLENKEAEKIMDNMKSAFKELQDHKTESALYTGRLSDEVEKLKVYELHYAKEENILYPYLDSAIDQHRFLLLLQLFHNDFRTSLSRIEDALNSSSLNFEEIIAASGSLFFVLFPLMFFENAIIYPIAFNKIEEKDWTEMLRQSMEMGWCFGIKPEILEISAAIEKE